MVYLVPVMARRRKPCSRAALATSSAMCSQGSGDAGATWRKGAVDGVVRGEEKVRAAALELAGRGEHEFGDGRPVIALDGLHVLAEAVGVHGDFRMHVAAEQGRSFSADGAIAEGGSFGGAGDDSDVQGLGHCVILRPWLRVGHSNFNSSRLRSSGSHEARKELAASWHSSSLVNPKASCAN